MKKFIINLLNTIMFVGTLACILSTIAYLVVSNNLTWFTGEGSVDLGNFIDGFYRYSTCRGMYEDIAIYSLITVLVSGALGIICRLFELGTRLITED